MERPLSRRAPNLPAVPSSGRSLSSGAITSVPSSPEPRTPSTSTTVAATAAAGARGSRGLASRPTSRRSRPASRRPRPPLSAFALLLSLCGAPPPLPRASLEELRALLSILRAAGRSAVPAERPPAVSPRGTAWHVAGGGAWAGGAWAGGAGAGRGGAAALRGAVAAPPAGVTGRGEFESSRAARVRVPVLKTCFRCTRPLRCRRRGPRALCSGPRGARGAEPVGPLGGKVRNPSPSPS